MFGWALCACVALAVVWVARDLTLTYLAASERARTQVLDRLLREWGPISVALQAALLQRPTDDSGGPQWRDVGALESSSSSTEEESADAEAAEGGGGVGVGVGERFGLEA